MSEEILQVRQYGKTNKIIKDLKERNDKLTEQYRLRDIRCISLERENERLQQKVEQLEEDKSYANWYAVKKEKKVEQLENIRKEAVEYVRNNFQQNIITGGEYLIGYSPCTDLLNILNKGSNKE